MKGSMLRFTFLLDARLLRRRRLLDRPGLRKWWHALILRRAAGRPGSERESISA